MSAVIQDVESGSEKAREAGDGLRRIVGVSTELGGEVTTIEQSTGLADSSATTLAGVIEQVGGLAQENNALAEQITGQSNGILEQIDAASSAAEESAASSEEVSASTEEVTAQVGDMTAQADGLSEITTELAEFLVWIGASEQAAEAKAAEAKAAEYSASRLTADYQAVPLLPEWRGRSVFSALEAAPVRG